MGTLLNNLPEEGRGVLILLAILVVSAILRLGSAWVISTDESEAIKLMESNPPKTSLELQERIQTLAEKTSLAGSLETLSLIRASLDSGQVHARWKRMYQDATWSSYLAGVFVFIGLLGTVLGISVALASLGQTVNASRLGASVAGAGEMNARQILEQSRQLQSGITTLLGSIQSASVCTLAGIAATLVVSYLNMRYLGRCRTLERQLATVIEAHVLPFSPVRIQRKMEGDLLRGAVDVSDKMASVSVALETILTSLNTEHIGIGVASEAVRDAAIGMTAEVRLLSEAFAELKSEQSANQTKLMAFYKKNQEELQALLRRFDQVLSDVGDLAENSPVRQQIMDLRRDLLDGSGTAAGRRDGSHFVTTPARAGKSAHESWGIPDSTASPAGSKIHSIRGSHEEDESFFSHWWGKIRGAFSRKSADD